MHIRPSVMAPKQSHAHSLPRRGLGGWLAGTPRTTRTTCTTRTHAPVAAVPGAREHVVPSGLALPVAKVGLVDLALADGGVLALVLVCATLEVAAHAGDGAADTGKPGRKERRRKVTRREGWREGWRDGWMEGGRESGREGGREGKLGSQ